MSRMCSQFQLALGDSDLGLVDLLLGDLTIPGVSPHGVGPQKLFGAIDVILGGDVGYRSAFVVRTHCHAVSVSSVGQ